MKSNLNVGGRCLLPLFLAGIAAAETIKLALDGTEAVLIDAPAWGFGQVGRLFPKTWAATKIEAEKISELAAEHIHGRMNAATASIEAIAEAVDEAVSEATTRARYGAPVHVS